MLCRVKRGRKVFYGKGRNTQYLVARDEIDLPDGEKIPDWAEPVKGKAKPAKKEVGHLGQTPVALSQMKGPVVVKDLVPMIEQAKTLEDLEKLVDDKEERKAVLDAFEKRKAELSEE